MDTMHAVALCPSWDSGLTPILMAIAGRGGLSSTTVSLHRQGQHEATGPGLKSETIMLDGWVLQA